MGIMSTSTLSLSAGERPFCHSFFFYELPAPFARAFVTDRSHVTDSNNDPATRLMKKLYGVAFD